MISTFPKSTINPCDLMIFGCMAVLVNMASGWWNFPVTYKTFYTIQFIWKPCMHVHLHKTLTIFNPQQCFIASTNSLFVHHWYKIYMYVKKKNCINLRVFGSVISQRPSNISWRILVQVLEKRWNPQDDHNTFIWEYGYLHKKNLSKFYLQFEIQAEFKIDTHKNFKIYMQINSFLGFQKMKSNKK